MGPRSVQRVALLTARNHHPVTYAIDSVIYEKGRVTVAIRVNGKRCCVLFRDDVVAAARDLYTQAVRCLP